MKAACYMGKHDIQVLDVPEPMILNQSDCIIKVSSTAICGSDLHLYNGYVPTVKDYDIMGHEFMGEIVDIGATVRNRKVGDRVIVPFAIACGGCYFCSNVMTSLCDNTNPNAGQQENVYGEPGAGIYGYSHMFGGYDGGQAQYVRVPHADHNTFVIQNDLPDEMLLFCTDVFPTGYQAAEQADIKPGDVVAVWGCGPVGQFAIASAMMMGASKVIGIDREPERLAMAARLWGAETMNFEDVDDNVMRELQARTGGRGPDVCIDAVGMEALGHGAGAVIDWAKNIMRMQSDRPNVLRQCFTSCRKGGTISIPGVYGGLVDSLNIGAAFNKGLTLKMGQTHVHRYIPQLVKMVEDGKIDPSKIITHVRPIEDAPEMYQTFKERTNDCIKVVLKPFMA
jgi:threonine dehydrogenase-like Zn-dependent dehydrogenase